MNRPFKTFEELKQNFYDRAMPEPNSGCWLWTGTTMWKGYGTICVRNVKKSAHRFSWKMHKGEIPIGMQVLHKCDVRPCVNPDHLFLGTNGDNMRDKTLKKRHHSQQKTHCAQGHPFTAENTYAITPTRRICRNCKMAEQRRRRRSQKEFAKLL